jgi:hypothetical protein
MKAKGPKMVEKRIKSKRGNYKGKTNFFRCLLNLLSSTACFCDYWIQLLSLTMLVLRRSHYAYFDVNIHWRCHRQNQRMSRSSTSSYMISTDPCPAQNLVHGDGCKIKEQRDVES